MQDDRRNCRHMVDGILDQPYISSDGDDDVPYSAGYW